MDELRHILIPIALFSAVVIGIIVILNFILKLRMINLGYKNDDLLLSSKQMTGKESALKWGLLILFGGIGLIIIDFIPNNAKAESPLPYGIEAVCLAAGFLIYYAMVRGKESKKDIE